MKRMVLSAFMLALLFSVFAEDAKEPLVILDPPAKDALAPAFIDVSVPYIVAADGGIWRFLPASMLSFVSHGAWVDELDLIARAPLALGNYSGYTLWTAYGNYLGENQGLAYSNIFDAGDNADRLGAFQLGGAMPVPFMEDWRMGILAGREYNNTIGNITNPSGAGAAVRSGSFTETQIEDLFNETGVADDLGKTAWTRTESWEATDKTNTAENAMVLGMDMGFLGLSVYAYQNLSSRRIGGIYLEEYAVYHADNAAWGLQPVKNQSLYGYDALGETAGGTDASGDVRALKDDSRTLLGALVQLPFNLLGYNAPLSANLDLDFYAGNYDDTEVPVRYEIVETHIDATDLAGATGQSHIQQWTDSVTAAPAWTPAAPGVFPGTGEPGRVVDARNSGSGYLAVGTGASVHPYMPLNEVLTLRAQLGLNYALKLDNTDVVERAYAYEAEPLTDTNTRTWTYSSVDEQKSGTMSNDFTFNLGSAAEFRNTDNSLALSVGLQAMPYVSLERTNISSDTVTTVRTLADDTGTAIVDGGAITYGGTTTGTQTTTVTTTYSGASVENTLGMNLAIPVSVRKGFFGNRLTFVGGYKLTHSNAVRYVEEPSSTTATTVTNPPAGATSVAETTEVHSFWQGDGNAAWAGNIDFMLRWLVTENITVDFNATSVDTLAAALNNAVGLNNGVGTTQIWNNIKLMEMSITFNF